MCYGDELNHRRHLAIENYKREPYEDEFANSMISRWPSLRGGRDARNRKIHLVCKVGRGGWTAFEVPIQRCFVLSKSRLVKD